MYQANQPLNNYELIQWSPTHPVACFNHLGALEMQRSGPTIDDLTLTSV